MAAIVWMDEWQQACCGEPFAVGSVVTWTLEPPDADRLAAVLGPAEARTVTHREERHDERTAQTPHVTGSVRSIRAVLSRPGPGGAAPVIEDIWTLEDYAPPDGELGLVGYLVELNVRPGT